MKAGEARRQYGGGRPLKRNDAGRDQRSADKTVTRLINAARTLFLEHDFSSVSIDDITKEAELSRATFYLHFANKEAILVSLVRTETTGLDQLYRWFSGHSPTRANIRRFLLLYLRVNRLSRRHLSLFRQAAAYNNDIVHVFSSNLERHLDTIGESVGAFRRGDRPAAVERRRLARARLLYYQLEQFGQFATALDKRMDMAAETAALVDAFYQFIVEFSYVSRSRAAAPSRRLTGRARRD